MLGYCFSCGKRADLDDGFCMQCRDDLEVTGTAPAIMTVTRLTLRGIIVRSAKSRTRMAKEFRRAALRAMLHGSDFGWRR